MFGPSSSVISFVKQKDNNKVLKVKDLDRLRSESKQNKCARVLQKELNNLDESLAQANLEIGLVIAERDASAEEAKRA